jgi:signal transduction histidine kinase/CheY-like chemotaxis protein/HPt (histidine-containing phosphotransfer) domain-containing protein
MSFTPSNADEHASLHDAISLWTGISSVLAVLMIAATGATSAVVAGIWIGAHAMLALVAAFVAKQARKTIQPGWMKARPGHLIMLISVLLWGLGIVLLSGGGNDMPLYLVGSGLACASVWLLSRDLLLIAATQACLFLPLGFRLLTQPQPDIATTLLLLVLILANVWIARRVGTTSAAMPSASTGLLAPTGPASNSSADLNAKEAQFQAERLSQELKAELERHKNIEDELKNAKQAAEAASMAKGEFLATMSHEIRTPLNGIIPLLEILRDSKLQPDQRDYLNTAYGSAKQLLSIIDDILDYSKIEANKLELEQVGMNLREVMDSVMRLMERPAQAKNLKINLKLDPQVRIAMRGDPTRLRQVLTNLVSNAVKFTERGGVQVEVTKRSESRTHQELLFAIKDTGIGISAEGQAKLFNAFQQADASTTRTFGGTGLGLVICQRIVSLMNGQIGVKSELGKGSVFWFSVPILKAAGDVGQGRRDLSGVRALVIANDQRITQRFNSALSTQGMTLTSTNTTADALGKLKSSSTLGENWAFELAVLDVNSMRSTAAAFVRNASREPSLERVKFLLIQSGEPLGADVADPKRTASVQSTAPDSELVTHLNRLLEVQQAGERRFSLLDEAPVSSVDTQVGPITGHVLLVEDNPVNRTVAMRVVNLIGLSVEVAENGKEAVEKLARGQFDAVLMDCQMPVMDGYTATRTRRTLEEERKLKRVPIIAMTANAMVGDREKCLASGMDDYMTKPLNRGLLEATLRKWLPPDAKSRPEFLGATLGSVDATAVALGAAPAAPAPVAVAPSPATAARNMEEDLLADLARAADAMIAGSSPTPVSTPATAAPAATAPPVARPKPTKPAIDRAIFDELLDVMGSEFSALVKVYLEDTPKNLKILTEAAARNATDAMIAPAHSLKSTSANLGALGLSEIAKRIEHNARSSILTHPEQDARDAVEEFERASAELKSLLGS